MKKRKNSEEAISLGNRLVILLSLLAVCLAVEESSFLGYIFLTIIFMIDIVYYRTVVGVYIDIKRVAKVIDQMVDGILSDRTLKAMEQTDDGVFSKICSKLYKLYSAKTLVIHNSKEEMNITHELISDISHQVKTPVSCIKMYSEMLEKKLEKEDLYHLYVIEEQVNKLDFLMQSLIKMSRLETKIISLKIQECSLLHILASVLSSAISKAEKKDISIETQCNPEIMVAVDFKWTVEAIFNVLDNAVKYTGKKGKIQINAELLESYVSLEIIDNGPGISDDEIPSIFKRFYRGENMRDKDGLGLGLALAREIIIMEKGFISVRSELGKGSDFRFMLPRGDGYEKN